MHLKSPLNKQNFKHVGCEDMNTVFICNDLKTKNKKKQNQNRERVF